MNEAQYKPIYLLAGHTTIDLTEEGKRLGGSVAYSYLAAKRLGVEPRVVTSHAQDLQEAASLFGENCVCRRSERTTAFRNVERGATRTQHLLEIGDQLRFESIPDEWQHPDILHLAPVYLELDAAFGSWFSAKLSCATLQGWLREVDRTGAIHPKIAQAMPNVLEMLDVAVYSAEDINHNMKWRRRIVGMVPLCIETLGPGGCMVYEGNREYRLATKPVETFDSTGAGDVFATAFFVEYLRTGNALAAARFGNEIARDMLSSTTFRTQLSIGGSSGGTN